MGKAAKSLTDAELKKLVRDFPADRSLQKRGCGGGLVFLIERTSHTHAATRWVFEYRFGGKRKSMGFGTYPDIGLSKARELAAGQKAVLRAGKDPVAVRKMEKQAASVAHLTTFDRVADAWLDSECNRPEGARQLSAVTMGKLAWLISLARPVLGTLQIGAVTEVDCVRAVEPIAKSGRVDTAHGVREVLSRVFNYAAVRGLRVGDPALALKRERSVLPAIKVKSHAAIVEPKAFGGLLRAIEGYDSGVGNRARRTTTLALKLITLTALRPFELRHLRWSLVDIDNGRIELPAETIKMRKPHTVYLSRQAVEILTELRSINGHGELVFPASHAKQVVRKDGPPVNRPTVRPISENTLNAALRRLGYGNADHVSHGFRTSMSTAANESGLFKSDIIEVTINHMDEDKVRAIYNRARYEAERKRLSQWWADYCDASREDGHPVSGNVVPMVRT